MFLAVDVGGTKTLVARVNNSGTIEETQRFPTDPDFSQFAQTLVTTLKKLATSDVLGVAVAVPGEVDYEEGTGLVFGNLPWRNVPITQTVQQAFELPISVLVENDANTAGLAEARALQPARQSVVYVTVSTGIGTSLITHNQINPHFRRSEGGFMRFERGGQLVIWESFASGHAIFERYGKKAADIPDGDPAWAIIAEDLALGLGNIAALLVPEVIIIGGGVGEHLPKFKSQLDTAMSRFKEKVIISLPEIRQALHPEEAVLYGCYHLIKDHISHV